MKVTIYALAMMLLPALVSADASDDTLRFYLARSELVVLGTIMSRPGGYIDEKGSPVCIHYACKVKIQEVLKGDQNLKGETISVDIPQFETGGIGANPLIAKDSECILFLKKRENAQPEWETADFWFGIQYPSPTMIESLKRLAKEK